MNHGVPGEAARPAFVLLVFPTLLQQRRVYRQHDPKELFLVVRTWPSKNLPSLLPPIHPHPANSVPHAPGEDHELEYAEYCFLPETISLVVQRVPTQVRAALYFPDSFPSQLPCEARLRCASQGSHQYLENPLQSFHRSTIGNSLSLSLLFHRLKIHAEQTCSQLSNPLTDVTLNGTPRLFHCFRYPFQIPLLEIAQLNSLSLSWRKLMQILHGFLP